MYTRLINAQVQPGKMDDFVQTFREQVLPDAQQEPGFKGIVMLKDAANNRVIAVVLWETEVDAQASIEGFQVRRFPKVAPYLAGKPTTETLEVILQQ
jgi:heme-degrading monooxygenase HmoA